MKGRKTKRNLYFYQWSSEYMHVAGNSYRVSCNIKDFEYDDNLSDFIRLRGMGVEVWAYLPLLWKPEDDFLPQEFGKIIDGIYIGNMGQLQWANETGKPISGDCGLNVFNGEAVEYYTNAGLKGITISYELGEDSDEITEYLMNKLIDETQIEILRYGRVPAMISEYCPLAGALGIKGSGCGRCMEHNPVYIKDNTEERYPVILNDTGCTSMILSKIPLNRKNCVKRIGDYDNTIERITVFDETPSFLMRI